MPTILPLDDDGNPIPAIRLRSVGGAHTISAGVTSASNSVAFSNDTRVVSLYATGPVFVRFGGAGVTASSNDHYFPSGVYYDFAIGGGVLPHTSHIAVLRASTDCIVYVSEKE